MKMANPFWAKVSFSDFIKHFRKMTDDQIVADIKESMDVLEDAVSDGTSFGAFLVRISQERIKLRGEVNRANALAGHEKAGHEIKNPRPPKPQPKFPSKEELYDFCAERSLDESLAREWFEITISRGGKTREGTVIENWKGAVTRYVEARLKNLEKDTK